jgi:uncharacterized protein YggE
MEIRQNLSAALRLVLIPVAVATVCALAVASVVLAARPSVIIATPAASTSNGTVAFGILASGDATVSRKPDLATISAGVQSQQSTAAAAQSDLAGKATKLINRIKALGVTDKDLTTSGYWLGPTYNQGGQTISGYRASEQLSFKWHNVDTVGKALDAVVQEGDATNIGVGFGLADPKSAQAEARSAAIADARTKAQAMASAAGIKLGPVIRVSDLSSYSRYPSPMMYASGAALKDSSQVPVGEMTVQVGVEVDFTIG